VSAGLDLCELSLFTLEQLKRALELYRLPFPLTELGLSSLGLDVVAERAPLLLAVDRDTALLLLGAVIAERRARKGPGLEIVWTGPEASLSSARDTAVVVRQLFEGAKESILIAGYSFYGGKEILAPLPGALRRGVKVELYLHIDEAPGGTPEEEAVRRAVESFLSRNWEEGAPRPAFYYDPRTVAPGSRVSLHAKCVVVDEQKTLITSANFTDRAQSRNIEVGALIEEGAFAKELISQWRKTTAAGFLKRWHDEG
jgi:phosphatidylserine/phosphatidylglycerophosphate/cardiolipin synthase-like enzyme